MTGRWYLTAAGLLHSTDEVPGGGVAAGAEFAAGVLVSGILAVAAHRASAAACRSEVFDVVSLLRHQLRLVDCF